VERHEDGKRHRVARDEPIRRGGVRTVIPRVDDRLQQAEGQERDDEPEHRQRGAELVAQAVAKYELEEMHHFLKAF
jgi:hypothetical protein